MQVLQFIITAAAIELIVWALFRLVRSLISMYKLNLIEKDGAPARSEGRAFFRRPETDAEAARLGIRDPVDFCYVMTILRYYEKEGKDGKKEIWPIDDRRIIKDELNLFCCIFGRFPRPLNDNMFSPDEYSSEWSHFLMWEVYDLIKDTSVLGSFEEIRGFVTPEVVQGIPVSKELENGLENLYRDIHEKRFAEYE